MDMKMGIENEHDNTESNKLNSSNDIQNINTLQPIGDNIKITKTQYIQNSNLKLGEKDIDILPTTNPTLISPIQIEETQNVFPPSQILETQIIPSSSIQPVITNNIQVENRTEQLISHPSQYAYSDQNIQKNSNQYMNSSELAAGSQIQSGNPLESQPIDSDILYNNSAYASYYNSLSNTIGEPQSQFIESQAIYGQSSSQFIESQEIYSPNSIQAQPQFTDSQGVYSGSSKEDIPPAVANQIEDIMNAKVNSYIPRQNIEVNPSAIQPNHEPLSHPEVIIVDDKEIKKVENAFNSLKVSKTKYLSKEELSNIMKDQDNINDDNIEHNENINRQVEPLLENPINPIEQTENVYSTAYNDNNIEMTNDVLEGENNAVTSNILGNDEFIKMSKTKYIDDTNYNEEIIEPPLDSQIKNENNSKVLKIEDVDDGCCPGLNCCGKLF